MFRENHFGHQYFAGLSRVSVTCFENTASNFGYNSSDGEIFVAHIYSKYSHNYGNDLSCLSEIAV